MNTITIREATLDDLDALVSLLGELFAIEADFAIDDDLQRQGLRLMLDGHPDRWVLVAENTQAEHAQQVVGMCTLQVLISTAEGGEVGLIEDMVIAYAYRQQGIGARLLNAMEHRAAVRGLRRLQLLADADNPSALTFYPTQQWQSTRLIGLRKKW
jgi:ribosomal protein S18 acetylase RimI-like enzyme